MSEVVITHDFSISFWSTKLAFTGMLPICIGYCRVSTDEQADEGFSLESQQKRIREWLDRKYGRGKYNIILIVEDESGTLPYDRGGMAKGTFRPGLTLAVEICRRFRPQMFVVARLNRLIRKARIFYELDDDVFRAHGVELHAIHEGISNSGSAQRLIAAIVAACAESERDNIVSVSRDGLRNRIEQGYYTGQTPFGWRWDLSRPPRDRRFNRRREEVRGRPRRDIEPHPDQAPYVRHAYDWVKAGKTLAWIASEFERLGVLAQRGGSHWSKVAVREVILNPTHAGLVRRDGELMEGKHYERRIVEPEEYLNVSRLFRLRASVGPPLKKSPNHVFGMHTTCGLCGRRLRVVGRPEGARFECFANYCGGSHPGYSVKIESVENRVVDRIRELALQGDLAARAARAAAEIVQAQRKGHDKERERAESELAKAKLELIRWCERFNSTATAATTDVVFEIYRDELTTRIRKLEGRLASLRIDENDAKAEAARISDAVHLLSDFDRLWEAMDADERKTLASYLVDYIRLTPAGNWVTVELKLVLQDEIAFRVPVRGRGGRASAGLESLSRAELTTAYYYLEGYTDHRIAEERDVSLDTVQYHRDALIRRTGSATLAEALELVRTLVEARKEELLLGVRRGRHYKEYFNPWHLEVLRNLAAGLSVGEIAAATGRKKDSIHRVTHRLYGKLDVHSSSEAVREARRRHLIEGPTRWSAAPTPKQLEVLMRLKDGENQRQAAESLGITLSALKERLRCMYDKFGVRTEQALLAMAHERGWL